MIREMGDKYLFQKMVVDLSDQEVEQELADGTFTISYLKNGEEIGIGLRKCEDGPIVKRWQVLSKPTFATKVVSGYMFETWKQKQEAIEKKEKEVTRRKEQGYCVDHQMRGCLACYERVS